MHKNFGEWYRLVAFEPDGAQLQKRWAGVEAWKAVLRKDDKSVLETVRIFQGLASTASMRPFLAVFQSLDPAFPQRNDLELRVLAGASLVDCVQSVDANGEGLHAAILASAALEASSLRVTEPRLEEIFGEVLSGLQVIAVDQRKRKPFVLNDISVKADSAAEALMQVAASTDWNLLKAAVAPVFQALLDSVRSADGELASAAHNLRCADEEMDILWWVEGGCSRDTNKPWAAFKEGAAIIAGTELADLIDVTLGPRNSAALLERVLSDSNGKDSPLAAYVNALPDEWVRERAAKANESAFDLTPLTFAMVHRARSDTASWQQYFDASSGMKSSTQVTAACVAHQAYVEGIMLRALSDLGTEE
ncbi:MAG TPA: GTPase-associated system all-helical protein GASH [Rectinemataceae bacterium]|nr:GTPase-associated system all-helical protein GASH [Rectinemataceae bacterium]